MSETIRRIVLPILLIVSIDLRPKSLHYHSYTMKFSRFRFRFYAEHFNDSTSHSHCQALFLSFFQDREKALLSCDSFINIPPIIPIVKHKIRIFLIIFSDCSGRLRSPYIYNRKKPAKRPHLRFCRLTIWRVAFLESERLCICTKTIWKFKVKKVNITWKNTILYSAILLTISLFLVYNISVP